MDGQVLILYHCNEQNKCLKFLNEKDYLISSNEDGIWLGSGMYFWDNVSNAKFWKQEKIKKGNTSNLCILCVKVSGDNILDLTDLDICNKIADIWIKLIKKGKIKSEKNNMPLGEKLNILYKIIPDFISIYPVIKVFGKYNKTPKNNLFCYNINTNEAEPTLASKCIYNIKVSKCILEKEQFFYKGEYIND